MSDFHQPPADHSVKVPHLVFGLLFLGVVAVWALVVGDFINEDQLVVIGPGVLIVAGVIGLAASLASTRNRKRRNAVPLEQHDQPTDDYAGTHPDDHTQEIR
jgi:hypothetical protein